MPVPKTLEPPPRSPRRPRRLRARRRPLTINQILDWADEHHERTGRWPGKVSGPVGAELGETWAGVNHALERGHRGLPGGTTLARFLFEQRGVPRPSGVRR